MSDFGLRDRTVAVTGAGRGIGRAIALEVAAAGAHVVGCSRTASDLASLADEIRDAGGRCDTMVCDVASPDSQDEFVTYAATRAGRLDGFVNNVGVSRHRPAVDYTADELATLFNVNLLSVFRGCNAAYREMVRLGSPGVVVNISSRAGVVSSPNNAPYGAAKAAINNLTKSFACEWAKNGVRVNAVAAGLTFTPQADKHYADNAAALAQAVASLPMQRFVTAREVALPTVFLLSDAAAMVTGHTLVVDGGWCALGGRPVPM